MTTDEVRECLKPPVFTPLVPFSASVVCLLTAGFPYLLMTYGEAN
jgi:hypothetical protein